ncbi:MAG: hypothetical protein QM586_12600 [Xenophilus sp.]
MNAAGPTQPGPLPLPDASNRPIAQCDFGVFFHRPFSLAFVPAGRRRRATRPSSLEGH